MSYSNNVLSHDINRNISHTKNPRPRGTWKVKQIWAINPATNAQRIPIVQDNVVYVQFEVTEPLLLSPFVFGSGMGKQGFYGIQTMNFQMNIASNANRAWRSAIFPQGDGGQYSKSVTIDNFADSTLLFQFLTPHSSDLLEPRNVVPYYELPIYRTTNFDILPPRALFGPVSYTHLTLPTIYSV